MLCFLCRKIQIKSTVSNWMLQHHLTFGDLTEAAEGGCELCRLFRAALLYYYAAELEVSIETARNLQWELDNNDIGQTEAARHVFYVELVDSGRIPGAFGLTFSRRNIADGTTTESVYPFVEFSVPAESNAAQGGWIVGRKIARHPDFSLGKKWIHECMEKHAACRSSGRTKLPPRVIDVGTFEGSPRLVLGDDKLGDYAALSHCWGNSKPMMTKTTTLKANLEGIPYAELPKTFQHAVIATRELGLRYLWIDSLCIIQDSREDWESHCSEMPDIYRNAIVTIAGPAAVDCNSGFLYGRSQALSVNLKMSNGEINQSAILSLSNLRDPYYPETERRSQLSKRAWVLQERLLSSRVLYFGSHFMYFECCTNVRREYLHLPFIDDFQDKSEVIKKSFSLEQERQAWLKYWCQIVETYSEAALTFASDKLPAISGIAREMQQKLQDRYIAGLWLSDIPRGLTWHNESYRERKYFDREFKDSALPYVAPSWSWASSKHGVSFCDKNYENHVFDFEHIQIIGADIKVHGSNRFGEVQEGVLTLRGRIQQFSIRPRSPENDTWYEYLSVYCNKPPFMKLGDYYPDWMNEIRFQQFTEIWSRDYSFGRQVNFLYLGCFIGREIDGQQKWAGRQWAALAIEAVPGTTDIYRRIGLGCGHILESLALEDFLEDVETKVVKLI